MHRLEREDFLRTRFIFLWSILGLQAGYINSFGFLVSERFVSHMTGIGTQVGFSMSQVDWLRAFELLLIPIFFIFGSFVSSTMTSVKIDNGQKPHFGKVMLLLPCIIAVSLVLAEMGVLANYEESIWSQGKFALIFLLSFVCGMQNGCFATMTKGQIRTTHLTGISTDLGTDLARVLFGNLSDEERRLLNRTNICRVSTFMSFAFGAVISVYATDKWHYTALLVPLFTSLAVYFSVTLFSQAIDSAGGKFPQGRKAFGWAASPAAPRPVIVQHAASQRQQAKETTEQIKEA